MRAIGFMILGALIASVSMNYDFSSHNETSIAKTKERIQEASQSRS